MRDINDKSMLPFFLVGVTSALCMAVMVLGFQATADQDPATDSVPRVIPYNGVLEFNGGAVTATGDDAPWLRFDLMDTSVEPDVAPPVVYSQSIQVNVYAGKFTAMLGPSDNAGVNIQDVVAGGDALELNIVVLNDPEDDTDDVFLSNPQRFVMSPFAVWATHATNFNVASDLTVGGAISSNSISAETAYLAHLQLVGHDLRYKPSERGDGGLAVVHDNADTLALNYAGTFGGGTRIDGNVSASSNVSASGDVAIGQNLSVGGNASITGTTNFTGNVTASDNISTNRFHVTGAALINNLALNTPDFNYAASARGDGGRALVHTDGDGLTLNYAGDFGGGLRIDGGVLASGNVHVSGNLTASNISYDGSITNFDMQRENFDGEVTSRTLQPSSTHFCALTKIRIGDDNDEDDTTMCVLSVNDQGTWILDGRTNADESTSSCGAACFRYR